jgi:hypothetical protein
VQHKGSFGSSISISEVKGMKSDVKQGGQHKGSFGSSISISEVKGMKSDVLQALKASHSEKNFEYCWWAQF